MGKHKIQPGDRFGRLIALDPTGESRHGRPVWRCLCECGNSTDVVSGSLLRKEGTRSCGCLSTEVLSKPRSFINLTGKRFGLLVVTGPAGRKRNEYAWACACDCGGSSVVRSGALKFGHTQSCGCLTKKAVSDATSSKITGKRFGRLVALERIGSRRGGALWRCACDCGNEHIALAGTLNSGQLVSCGCASIDRPGLRSKQVRASSSIHDHKRRARVRGATGSWTTEQITDLSLKQRGRCANCGTKLGDKFHRDHKVALANGGTNDIGNMELLCKPCNLAKNAKDPIVWANLNGRLI